MLPEDKEDTEVKDHGNDVAGAQRPIAGERSTGNVINVQIHHTAGDVHVSVGREQPVVEVRNCKTQMQNNNNCRSKLMLRILATLYCNTVCLTNIMA